MSTAGHVRKSNKLNLTRRHFRHWSSSVLSVTLLLFDMIQHKQKCSQQLGITFIVLLVTQWVLLDHHLGILLRNFEPVHLNLMKYSDRSRSNPTFLSRLTHPSGLSILLPLEGQAVELGGASLPPAGLSHGPSLDTVLAVALPGLLVLLSLSLTLTRAGLLGWTCRRAGRRAGR